MAKTTAVWGIDIGNSSLKAIRCRPSDVPGKVDALAFDYIEHSKILSQPGADPVAIMSETLKNFLSRNRTKGDKVAISVSGQNTISRFLRLPPVDPKKVPDILRYEAKQWLPFALDDVIWDFQPIGIDDGTEGLLDSEIGMFAMKKDVAMRTLKPYLASGIDIDCIQSSPLSLYNYVTFDLLRTASNEYELDPTNPPDHAVVLCVGTDATDVVITNGFSIWIRSIVIGGNNFTKALTKGLKLTFSKAEYLKRNAAMAQDPKAVFQAMRPVFNEMLAEVHRSMEFYQSINRKAKFSKILALGNAMKMPGLRQFLTQNLGYEVMRLSHFQRLTGDEVLNAPQFKENLISFGVAYGLAIQAMDAAPLATNLIPKEVVTERIIREKKPWALATCATLLAGLTVQYVGAARALETVKRGGYETAESAAKSVQSYSGQMTSGTGAAVSEFEKFDLIGKNLTVSVEGRIVWNELFKAINAALPVETAQLSNNPKLIEKQERIFIASIDTVKIDDMASWFNPLKEYELYIPEREEVEAALAGGGVPAAEGGGEGGEAAAPAAAAEGEGGTGASWKNMIEREKIQLITGPEAKPGKIVQLVGYHFHNGEAGTLQGAEYVRQRFLRRLKGYGDQYNSVFTIRLPAGMQKRMVEPNASEEVTMKELGIGFPTIIYVPEPAERDMIDPNAILRIYIALQQQRLSKNKAQGGMGMGSQSGYPGGMGDESGMGAMGASGSTGAYGINPFADTSTLLAPRARSGKRSARMEATMLKPEDKITLRKFDFVIQFAWVETLPSVREEEKKKLAETAQQTQGSEAEVPREEATATEASPPVVENAAESAGETVPSPENEPTP